MRAWKGLVGLGIGSSIALVGWAGVGGCAGGPAATGDDDDTTDTTGDDDDNAGDDDDAEPERACDDGRDNDDDGDADCDDDDCEAEVQCTWPEQVQFDSRLEFDANTLAELGGYSDCRVTLTSDLEVDRTESCDGCDRVFSGPFTFLDDDCPEDFDRPESGAYGVAFRAEDRWEVFGRVDDVWSSLGIAEDDGTGTLVIEIRTPVEYDGLEVGDLTSQFSFTPR